MTQQLQRVRLIYYARVRSSKQRKESFQSVQLITRLPRHLLMEDNPLGVECKFDLQVFRIFLVSEQTHSPFSIMLKMLIFARIDRHSGFQMFWDRSD